MTDDHEPATDITQHAGRDLTGKRSGILCRDILGTELDNAIVDSRRHLGQIDVWRAHHDIGTELRRQARPQATDQGSIPGTTAVQLPVTGYEGPSI
jgi:hypothetical protein